MCDSLLSHNTLNRAIRTFRLAALQHMSTRTLLIYSIYLLIIIIKAKTQ